MGTHNEASCLYLQKGVQKRAIAPEDARIWISQLYGMSDNISYGMAQAGFRVAKYIPYGPYKQLLLTCTDERWRTAPAKTKVTKSSTPFQENSVGASKKTHIFRGGLKIFGKVSVT